MEKFCAFIQEAVESGFNGAIFYAGGCVRQQRTDAVRSAFTHRSELGARLFGTGNFVGILRLFDACG